MSNHLKRVYIALIGIPLIIGATLAGGFWYFALIALLSTLCLDEVYSLSREKGIKPLVIPGMIAGIFILLAFINTRLLGLMHALFGQAPGSESQFFLIVVLVSVAVFSLVELFRNNGSPLLNLSSTMMGLFYVSLGFGTLLGIRELFTSLHVPVARYFSGGLLTIEESAQLYRWGGYTVVAIYSMIWICDSAAYYVGSAIGKHKLFPRVSPNKSWEGAIAGFLFAVVAAVAAKYLFLEYLELSQACILGMIVGIFGQLGDLFESLLKRDAGVKDSSNRIPGHGGFLDRFDSLIFVSPLVYLYLDFIVFSF